MAYSELKLSKEHLNACSFKIGYQTEKAFFSCSTFVNNLSLQTAWFVLALILSSTFLISASKEFFFNFSNVDRQYECNLPWSQTKIV